MRTLRGRMEKSDLEGGIWILVTDAGERYQVDGAGPDLYVEGRRVEVSGDVAEDMMGFGMVGSIFEVKKYSVER